jgi:prepilin-type N-terminal cleavage/methylation domain-containing protein
MSQRHRRSAFTLPEVLVAVLLFGVGLLGLAATGTAVAAQVGDARELLHAAELAGSVIDSLRASPCRSLAAGARAGVRAQVTWTATPAPSAVQVDATLDLPARRGSRRWTFTTLVPCDR